MDAKLITGKAFGVPVGGTIVNINSADTTALLASASGLAKILFFTGGALALALSMSTSSSFLGLGKNKVQNGMRLDNMSYVNSENRRFFGVCLDENFNITCDKSSLSIPVAFIKSTARVKHENEIYLFDDSAYRFEAKAPLNFLTIIGKQRVWPGRDVIISGATVTQRDEFINQLNIFLEKKEQFLFEILGKDKFEQFFYPGE